MAGSIELWNKISAPFKKSVGGPTPLRYSKYVAADNDYTRRILLQDRTDSFDAWGSDALNNLLIGGGFHAPLSTPITLRIQANGKIGQTTPFFVNDNSTTPLEVTRIDCIFSVTDGAANTGYVSKDLQGQIAGKGASCMNGTFNLNATANTLQTALSPDSVPTETLPSSLTLAGYRGTNSLVLGVGEQLTFNIASAITNLAGLVVTVWVRPHTGAAFAQYNIPANGDIATMQIFLNIIPGLTVRSVAMRWSTAATNAGTVTADVFKDASGTAPGGGSSILGAAQSVKGAANTTVYPTLGSTAGLTTMAVGDRLTVVMTGTLTALAGLVVTVFFSKSVQEHILIPFNLWDAPATTRTIFIAKGFYQVIDCWETWSTVSGSNTQLLEKDTGTTAPGSGTGLQTDNTNAGILTSGTINTPIGSLLLSAVSTKPTLWLAPGDRLALKMAGTAGSLAGVCGAILLRRP